MRILLVEDDPIITRTLSELLRAEGYDVDSCATQDEAIALGCKGANSYDLALLDLTLAQGNGFAVCSAIKEARPQTPVIFLTASGDEFNTVAGLSMGADDYVAKPFRPRELMARIASVLRRSHAGQQKTISFGPISIDPERAKVTKTGQEIILSALEYRLLLLFATNRGKLVTRDMAREALWDDAGAYIEENTLSVYIKRLRDKIEDDPSRPTLIVTVRGLGYKSCE